MATCLPLMRMTLKCEYFSNVKDSQLLILLKCECFSNVNNNHSPTFKTFKYSPTFKVVKDLRPLNIYKL